MSAEKIFAALMVTACVVLAIRLALGETRRHRFDAAVSRFWRRTGGTARAARELASRPGAERRARRAAADAIRRAKSGSWEGNVFRPSSFNGSDDKRGGDRKPGENRRKNLH